MASRLLLCSALVVVTLDQASKRWVLSAFRAGRASSFGIVAIRLVMNPHGAGGRAAGRPFLVALWVLAVALLFTAVELLPRYQSPVIQVALGAALGGAAGNLIDRIWRGRVVDFIDLRFWPIFNLADVAIVTGALLAVLRAL